MYGHLFLYGLGQRQTYVTGRLLIYRYKGLFVVENMTGHNHTAIKTHYVDLRAT